MKIVVFGLTVTSSWGNGHATLWRGLLSALARAGHHCVFYERDTEYYARTRDLDRACGYEIRLYRDFAEIAEQARWDAHEADLAMVTSYCPDARDATEVVLASRAGVRAFYDLDTGPTLERLARGDSVEYLPAEGLVDFDLTLSFVGGPALNEISARLGAVHVKPLYGCVDPAVHAPSAPITEFHADLSYLGTYATDRQAAVLELFCEPARRRPGSPFLLCGPMYPSDFPWEPNIRHVAHVSPPRHAAFYASSRMTLNVTRQSMARAGHCPQTRMFEAAACGAPMVSDAWEGLETFFEPRLEIVLAHSADDVLAALAMNRGQRLRMAEAARKRVLSQHTAEHRARELLQAVRDTPLSRA